MLFAGTLVTNADLLSIAYSEVQKLLGAVEEGDKEALEKTQAYEAFISAHRGCWHCNSTSACVRCDNSSREAGRKSSL